MICWTFSFEEFLSAQSDCDPFWPFKSADCTWMINGQAWQINRLWHWSVTMTPGLLPHHLTLLVGFTIHVLACVCSCSFAYESRLHFSSSRAILLVIRSLEIEIENPVCEQCPRLCPSLPKETRKHSRRPAATGRHQSGKVHSILSPKPQPDYS